MGYVHPYLRVDKPLIMAHRGDSAHFPGNTIDSFRRAVELGADVLELDVHWTRDGVIVVCHNATVDDTSDGVGRIRDMTLAQLKTLDFGYHFTPDAGRTYPFRGTGVQICTLAEVLSAFPRMRVNIDIKPKLPVLLRQLILDIASHEAFGRVMVASFHHVNLATIRQMNPRVATSASPVEAAKFRFPLLGGRLSSHPPFHALQVPYSIRHMSVVTPEFVSRAHALGLHVHVWTVDDKAEMLRLLSHGIDGIVTNHVGVGVLVRDKWMNDGRFRRSSLASSLPLEQRSSN